MRPVKKGVSKVERAVFTRAGGASSSSLLLTLLSIPFLLAPSLALEPPRPGEIDRLRRSGVFDERLDFAAALGNHRFDSSVLEKARLKSSGVAPAPPSSWEGMPATGNVKIMALLIAFSDESFANSTGSIDSKLFGAGDSSNFPYESLANYYARSSYGQLSLAGGNTLGWYTTAYPRSEVPRTTAGRQNLIREALDHWDGEGHDFSQYDNDGDGDIDYFIVIWTGPDTGWATFWWGYQTHWSQYLTPYTIDGKRLSKYSWQWESRPPGGDFSVSTVIHETGHALGLPDYYDYDDTVGPVGGVGYLDMMDGGLGDHNSFSKWMLDWIAPTVVTSGTQVLLLRSSGTSRDAVVAVPEGQAGQLFGEYFVVQNRHKEGNDDQWFPTGGEGLLVWHVDARLNAEGSDFAYDNSYTDHKLLRLMEADGLEEIERGGAADADDYYRKGSSLSPTTFPSSNTYDGSASGILMDTISAADPSMTARFLLPCPPPDAPTTVSATDGVHADRVVLSWSPVAAADGYEVWRGTAFSRDAAEKISSPGAGVTGYEDFGVTEGITYWYRVKSRKVCGSTEAASGFSGSDIGYVPAPVSRTLAVCPAGCPFPTIQEAVNDALAGDTLSVDDGTYVENIDFFGKAIAIRSVNGPEVTVIDGRGGGSVVSFASGEGPDSELEGFSLINGSGTECGDSSCGDGGIYGGGIYGVRASPTIIHCDILNNSAAHRGGGAYFFHGSPTVIRSRISGNRSLNGGGFFGYSSDLHLINTLVSGNSAGSSGGGGYFSLSGRGALLNSTIAVNVAGLSGGGVYSWGSTPEIVNGILWGNRTDGTLDQLEADGGGWINAAYSDIEGGDQDTPGSPWPGMGNIDLDPLFREARPASEAPTAAGDYHIGSGSPCIDSGTGDTSGWPELPDDDFDGDARPEGPDHDMGYDEYRYRLRSEAADVGGGWYWLEWFGYFNLEFDPWIFHGEHGFLYPVRTAADGIVLWDSGMEAFWWTSEIMYPYVYRFSDGEWLWYLEGSRDPRLFSRLSDGSWEEW